MVAGLKQCLRQGKQQLGTMVTELMSPNLPRMLSAAGCDFVIVDCEHGAFSYREAAVLAAAAQGCALPLLFRIPEIRREPILKYLEIGAAGLLVPQVESAEQVKEVVQYARYAPLGRRGVSLKRPHTGYRKPDDGQAYMRDSNETITLIAQIETAAAVDSIEQIAAVPGLDAVLIGPNDLTQDMGIYGEYDHPQFHAAVDTVVAAAANQGRFSGTHMTNLSHIQYWKQRGMTILMYSSEAAMLMDEVEQKLGELR